MNKIYKLTMLSFLLAITICLFNVRDVLALTEVTRIDSLNNVKKALDSNRENTANSTLEFNYRDSVVLENINILGSEVNNVDNTLTLTDGVTAYFSYPRLITLKDPVDEFKYILTFQSTQDSLDGVSMSDNGIDIYYMRSNDLKQWTDPQFLFRSDFYLMRYLYYGAEILEYKDASNQTKLMALTCKYGFDHWKYEGAAPFNRQGLYIKTSSDGGVTWSEDETEIYTGPCWDASAIQLDSGEIQVYMTHIAPIMYLQSSQVTNKEYHAVFSGYHNSSGVAMISSLDYGQTWTPNVQGTTEKISSYFSENTRNPYSAYRVAQEWWKYKETRQSEPSEEPYNFYGISTNGSKVYGIEMDDSTVYHMVDGMTSPVELNNKQRIVLPLETGSAVWEKKEGCNYDKCLYQTDSISVAYSDKTDVDIDGTTKQKYWLDINDNTEKSFNSEKDVYDSEGLELAEEGPINRENHLIERGSGPSLTQFESGETLLAYHTWPNMFIKIGNSNAEFTGISAGSGVGQAGTVEAACGGIDENENYTGSNNNNKVTSDTICVNGISYWGSIETIDSHKVILTKAYKADSNGKVVSKNANFIKGVISLSTYYLNHTLDVVSKENTEALFIGSESQAQASIRASYDANNLKFRIDVLDSDIKDNDQFELYVSSMATGTSYLKVIAKSNGTSVVTGINNPSSVTVTVNKYDTKDDNGGYVINVTIPRVVFSYATQFKVNGILNNVDTEIINNVPTDITVRDTFAGVTIEDKSTWMDIKFRGSSEEDHGVGALAKNVINHSKDSYALSVGDLTGDDKLQMNDVMSLISLLK